MVVAPKVQLKSNATHEYLRQSCSLEDHWSRAHCILSQFQLTCSGGFTSYWTRGVKREITHLRVLDWAGVCFNIARLQYHFPELVVFELINSTRLRSFTGKFNDGNRIEKLKIQGMTSLWEIPPELILEMRRLREMDLRGNMLRHMKHQLLNGPMNLERVFLGGNSWDCSDGGLDWLAMEAANSSVRTKIMDYDELLCHHQLYIGKPLNKVMEIIRTMRETCPLPCACKMTHVVQKPSHVAHAHGQRSSGDVIPIIKVDCANRQLEEPPESLPPATTTLRLEGNKVKHGDKQACGPPDGKQSPQPIDASNTRRNNCALPTLKTLDVKSLYSVISPATVPFTLEYRNDNTLLLGGRISDTAVVSTGTVPCTRNLPPSKNLSTIKTIAHNPQYRNLADLFLDNNSISAVKEFEGTEWFSTFRVLSLRGNMLKQIPVYAFDKAFQANNNIMYVFLGNNPWRCDCHFIPRFQGLLLKYKKIIQDLSDVRCSKSNDKKTSLVQISTIPLGNICGDEVEMPISPVNIVNLVLLGLIFLVLGRFLYDWRAFKATGKLPWLSSALP